MERLGFNKRQTLITTLRLDTNSGLLHDIETHYMPIHYLHFHPLNFVTRLKLCNEELSNMHVTPWKAGPGYYRNSSYLESKY